MATVPGTHDFADGIAVSSEMNSYVRDPINFLLAPPIAQLRQDTVQSIPNATDTALLFDAEAVDSANGHDNTTNKSRYTAVYAGWYAISGAVGWASNTTGSRYTIWKINGTNVPSGATLWTTVTGVGSGPRYPAQTMHVYLNVGDYLELFVGQSSGGALNTDVTDSTAKPSMAVRWVSN